MMVFWLSNFNRLMATALTNATMLGSPSLRTLTVVCPSLRMKIKIDVTLYLMLPPLCGRLNCRGTLVSQSTAPSVVENLSSTFLASSPSSFMNWKSTWTTGISGSLPGTRAW